ncbi:otop2 [Pungitius sinensis]
MPQTGPGASNDSFVNRSQRRQRMCLKPGNPSEPCRMTAKDQETEEAHLSNTIDVPTQVESAREPDPDLPPTLVSKERSRNWGWILSGIICMNVLILGCVLVSGTANKYVNIVSTDLQIFIIVLLLLTSIWMVYYLSYTVRKENAVDYKDGHAGPIWLRGGLLLFGFLSILMDIFKIASYAGYLKCDSAITVAFPAVQLVFVLVQTYFLWIHAKDCVQLQRNFTRCGLMLTLSTNLVMWMTAVTEESVHHDSVPESPSNITHISGRSLYISKAGFGNQVCNCSHTSCSIFKEAYYYLYPFNIEYSLFASAMAYIMWKNVGRVTEERDPYIKFHLKNILIGPLAGLLLVGSGLATFVLYEMAMVNGGGNAEQKDKVLLMYFVMNIVITTLMSVSTVIGCAIYIVDHRERVSEKNPTRSLDVGLLIGTSLGQFTICYFTIVAMAATGAIGYLNRLNLSLAVLMVIQIGLQNLFIIKGLHREPFHKVYEATVVQNPYVLQPGKELSNIDGPVKDTKPSPAVAAHSVHGHSTEHKPKLLWKRWILKEICAFLLLANIILWIMPAFGARPQFDLSTETEFYTLNMWTAVVNIGLPFGIFYRMHSVASLFEVFQSS